MDDRKGSPMEFQTLLATAAEGVARLTLNRPERKNAYSPRMATELMMALAEYAEDPAVRVVVLRGAGENFCSGGDLQGDGDGAESGGATDFMERCYNPSILALHHFPKPVIAVVEGVAAGAGVNLVLACDLAYAAEGARFAELFVRRSLALDCGGSWLLPRVVGLNKAKELAFFGGWLDAQDAKRFGLVADVFGQGELEEEISSRAAQLEALPPIALAEIKRGLNASFEKELPEALAEEAAAQEKLAGTADFAEAMRAFLEKRPAVFRGR